MKEDKEAVPIPAAKGRQTSIASFFGAKPGHKAKAAEKATAPGVAAKDVVQPEIQGENVEKKKRVRNETKRALEKALGVVAPISEAVVKAADAVEAVAAPPDDRHDPEAVANSDHVAGMKKAPEEGVLGEEEAAPKAKRRRRLVKASDAEEVKKVPLEGRAEEEVNESFETEAAGAAVEPTPAADEQAMEEDTLGKGAEQAGKDSTQHVRSFFTRKAPKRASPKKEVGTERQEGKAEDDEAGKGTAKGALKKGKAEAFEGVQAVIPAAEVSEREKSPSPEEVEDEDLGETLLVTEAALEQEEEAAPSKAAKKKAGPKAKAKPKAKGAPGIGDGLTALATKHASYDPLKAATWKPGERVPFLFLAQALDAISNESGRLAMTELLCNVFRTVIATSPGDLLPVVYLVANKVAPAHEGVELGIGEATLVKALAEATGRKEAQIKIDMKKAGDLGIVAQASRTTQRTMFPSAALTCGKVLDEFRFIAKESGTASQDKKRARIKALLVAARECEPLYLMRQLGGKMRIGLAEQTVISALGQAVVLSEDPPVPPKDLPARLDEAGKIMKKVYSECPSFDEIVPALLEVGVKRLPEVCHFKLGVPVKPMLAKPTKGVTEVLDKFQDRLFTCEYKYDGERAQVHGFEDGSIFVYSRSAENVTERYPDIRDSIAKYVKPETKSFVIDCEAVAYDRVKDKILPFQVLSTRARKQVQTADIKVQLCLYAFDLLYLNGEALIEEQLRERREKLFGAFEEVKGEFQFAKTITSRELEEMQQFLNDAVDHSCEGLIVKTLTEEATYEPSQRSNHWLKLKKDYMDTVGDTIDLVPIGAFYGGGKRAGVYGAYLLACHDEENDEYQAISKIGTGFSDVMLTERFNALKDHVIDAPKPYYQVDETFAKKVDVWFEPHEVWEVKAADLSISPHYRAAAGVVDPSKGISVRFPRFIRLREDKKPESATSSEQIAEMYRSQKINHVGQAGDEDD
ncbi:putative DNA ligase 1 [Klebsormidium nitens]|uniref:DNA ligase n=1 Tax=Klebsormidium nitens TaxID=105231 RepID=A0A1Y1IBU8_KLENI|nr:putative DNA ligase 1 [Klebsormidium nitens]|eukprot:GAQ85568.1 putative DNA ligase 1 [Klebsormidium nitens]